MAHEELHEDPVVLGSEAIDRHRAIVSLMEEFEAIDWYDQRIAATSDEALRAILVHNRDEEKEHAVMLLEWWRRQDSVLDAQLKKHLFGTGPIRESDGASPKAANADAQTDGGLAIGGLRTKKGFDDESSVA